MLTQGRYELQSAPLNLCLYYMPIGVAQGPVNGKEESGNSGNAVSVNAVRLSAVIGSGSLCASGNGSGRGSESGRGRGSDSGIGRGDGMGAAIAKAGRAGAS